MNLKLKLANLILLTFRPIFHILNTSFNLLTTIHFLLVNWTYSFELLQPVVDAVHMENVLAIWH